MLQITLPKQFKLYLKSQESKDLELAKSSLEHLISEINLEHESVEIYNPEGWVIGVWPGNIVSKKWYGARQNEKSIPNFCSNLNWESCICICKNRKAETCDEKGVCENNENKLVIKEEWISTSKYRQQILEGDKNYIEIENPPIKLLIKDNVISKK